MQIKKKTGKKNKKSNNPARFDRTIAIELHRQWRKLERKNDAEKIADLLEVSKPTIDKALIYGCVHQQKLVDGITKYFADRIISEKEDASHLKELAAKKLEDTTP